MHGKTLAFMTAALFVATVPQAALASPLIGGALAAEKVSPVENATTTATAATAAITAAVTTVVTAATDAAITAMAAVTTAMAAAITAAIAITDRTATLRLSRALREPQS
ncbi:hypothetical protein [Pseudorhodoplanes sp.]|jgi:hypothetical protein|uniref:hypothetical protein n=1 Tax=Pseudorhodoplanes sp. TaxID=1934341 RepID=UPI002D80ABDB|nr:hypothetical protein [Pseudorhodoplanes sp.]